MKLIDAEKLAMFQEQSGHILRKPFDQRTVLEDQWLQWAAKRIMELEAAK
jgi:hypothetical protein